MKQFAVVAVIPLFAGFLWAQEAERAQQPPQQQTTEITTTKTTWNGTLVDAVCQTTHSVRKESSTSNPNESTARTETTQTTTDTTDCPITTTTTSFGLLTREGKFVRFDDPSNVKVIEIAKSNKEWKQAMEGKKPVKVQVVGTANGEVVLVETIK
jgi:hypothetical protein